MTAETETSSDEMMAAHAQKLGVSPGELQAIADTLIRLAAKVKPSLAKVTFTAETSFEELGVDSLTMISLLFEVEEYFDISIVDRHLDDIETFGEMCAVVVRLNGESS